MSTPPPPYGGPGGPVPSVPPAYQKRVPSRRRPSGWWFVVAVGLMLAGVALGVLLLVQTFRGFLATDATVPVDGQAHQVSVPATGDRILWFEQSVTEPACEVRDAESGDVLRLRPPDATYTRDNGSIGDSRGAYVFDPGSGTLEVTCSPALPTVVQIGPAPAFGAVFGGLAAAILLALGLGGGGFVLLIVLIILFATGRPRTVPAPL